ncbi:hypothetical protein BDN71DRAFT_1514412 [Pleurotus eryngii]|uniref:Uncharacterized protein n=1 Tax=Pleurotus eryngii TaxID=5323 RepID=A0A9P6D128_PLEER|nr:hypothetical protein BDN71DRAFT_1514412 [Pleurotus eryngii]
MPFFVYLRAKIDVSPMACLDASVRHHVGTQCFSTRTRVATRGMPCPGLLLGKGERENEACLQLGYSARPVAPWAAEARKRAVKTYEFAANAGGEERRGEGKCQRDVAILAARHSELETRGFVRVSYPPQTSASQSIVRPLLSGYPVTVAGSSDPVYITAVCSKLVGSDIGER